MAAKKKKARVVRRSSGEVTLAPAQVVALLQKKGEPPRGLAARAFALWIEGDETLEKPLSAFLAKNEYGPAASIDVLWSYAREHKRWDDAASIASLAIAATKRKHGALLLAGLSLLAKSGRALVNDNERLAWRNAMIAVGKPFQLQLAIEALLRLKDNDGVIATVQAIVASAKRDKQNHRWASVAEELVKDKGIAEIVPAKVLAQLRVLC